VSRHDPRPEEPESRADPPALAPLQSAHLSPWSDLPTSSRGIRPDKPSFALTTRAVSWLCRPCGPRCLCEVGCRDTPPPTSLSSVHSPEPTLLPIRFGPEAACLGIPFRPRGFAPPRRFPPLERPRACCIPLPVMGFVAFRAFAVLATLFTPLEEFHSTAAAPRHRGRCRLAVPSRPARLFRSAPLPESTFGDPLDGSAGFEALLRRRVRDAIRPLPAGGRPILPGLRSPSRSFPEVREHPRSLALALHRPWNSKSPRRAGAPFRTRSACASRATPAASLRRAIGWDGGISARPKTLAVLQLAPDIEEVPKNLSHRETSSRPKPHDVSHRGPAPPEGGGDGARRGRNPFVGYRESRASLALSRA